MESADELLSRTLFHLEQCGDHKRYSDFYSMVATLEEHDGKFILGHWYLHSNEKPSLEELQQYPKEKVQQFFTQCYQIPAMIVATTDHLVSGPQNLIDEVDTTWLQNKIIFNDTKKHFEIFINKKWCELMYWDADHDEAFSIPEMGEF